MKRLLMTAFEPFGGKAVNASAVVLNALPGQIGGYEVHRKELPVVFGKAAELVSTEGYDAVFLLGEAGRESVTPETTARNIRAARIPDNEGNKPEHEKISEDGPDEYHTSFPVRKIVSQMKEEGYDIEVSDDAGTFVCNDTFYLTGVRSSVPVEFIHVPSAVSEETVHTACRFLELAIVSLEMTAK